MTANASPPPSRRRVLLVRAGIILFLLLAILMGFDRAMRPADRVNIEAPAPSSGS